VARPLTLPLALILSLAAAEPLLADARQDYVDGLRALREGRFAAALGLLDRAIAERPREEPRARLVGAIPEPYLPHHYRGIALYNLRRCDDALAAWRLSASGGALAKSPERTAAVTPLIKNCEALLQAERDLATATSRAGAPAARTQRLAAAIEEAKSGWRIETMPGLAAEAAQLLEASASPLAPATAETPAGRAAQTPEEPQPTASAATEPAPTPSAAKPTPPASPPPSGPIVRQDRSPSFSPVLLRAATAFAAGEYEAVLEALNPNQPLADRVQRHLALLLRAASRHALYRLGGAARPDYLDAARADVRELGLAQARLRVDTDSFSPAFVEFYFSSH